MQQASESMLNWCTDNELVINVGKTKEMFFSNLRFNPVCDDLFLNDLKLQRVVNFTNLGTILDSKMNFKLNTENMYIVTKSPATNFHYEAVVFP